MNNKIATPDKITIRDKIIVLTIRKRDKIIVLISIILKNEESFFKNDG